jgi:LytR cell envelope-related transcriptional attenuator
MKRRRIIIFASVLALSAIGPGASVLRARQEPKAALSGSTGVRAPADVRIRVRVLNATRTHGLARRATRYLRDRGFDVVESGTSRETRDSTIVIDHSHHAEWAALVAKAMGGRVVSRPDSSRYLDVTVLVGASWRPPAEAFHP